MISNQQLEKKMGIILLAGIILALILVAVGGAWYLIENGSAPLQTDIFKTANYQTNISQIWKNLFSISAINIIELGLFVLIITQIIRVGMLACFYLKIKDRWFAAFSLFVFLVLVYSFFSGNLK